VGQFSAQKAKDQGHKIPKLHTNEGYLKQLLSVVFPLHPWWPHGMCSKRTNYRNSMV